MTFRLGHCLALLLCAVFAGIAGGWAQVPGKTNVLHARGTVVDGQSGKPVARALVCTQDRRIATLTDNEGRFDLQVAPSTAGPALAGGQLPQGVEVTKPGYFGGMRGIDLTASQNPGDPEVQFTLMPAGSISGRVTIPASDAPRHVAVVLLRYATRGAGRRSWTRVGQDGTDSRGRFQFADLMPGVYTVVTSLWIDEDEVTPKKTEAYEAYPPVYNGDAADLGSATLVHLHYGDAVQTEIHLHKATLYPVRVPVTTPAATAAVEPIFTGQDAFSGYVLQYDPDRSVVEGSLPSGSYNVLLVGQGPPPAMGAVLPLHVDAGPVQTAPFALAPLPEIPVHVNVQNSGGSSQPAGAQAASVELELQPETPGAPVAGGSNGKRGQSRSDREFALSDVVPGTYWVRARVNPGYIAAISAGGVDLRNQPLTVSANGAPSPIEVTVGDGTVDLTGTVQTGDKPLPKQTEAIAMPVDGELDLPMRSGGVEPDGRFTLVGLSPGVYRVFAVANGQTFPNDPEGLRALPSSIPTVTVTASQTSQVEVPLLDASVIKETE